MDKLTTTDPRVTDFLAAWHENGRARFERDAPNLVYDRYAAKRAKDRRKYLALDRVTLPDFVQGQPEPAADEPPVSASGVFLVDKTTGEVYTIKAYGVPNRRLGTLAELTEKYRAATAAGYEAVGR